MNPIDSLIPNTINPDLQKERDSASFDVEEFAQWWHGGADKLKLKREIEKALYAEWDFDAGHFHDYASYEELYDRSIKNLVTILRTLRGLQAKYNPNGNEIYPKFMLVMSSHGMFPVNHPLLAHFAMFLDAVANQGTPEQIEKFHKPAYNLSILGTYAQTELGHGNHVRGIQTRADFDRSTDEFILNTPCLEAYKWWPAGMGQTVNYAIVVAQLYIDNENKGIQMFMVPVRDRETHKVLPGLDIGEIGPKIGMNGSNQGFLGLKNFRIPRTNMLMKYAQVLPDGSFIESPLSALTYMTMVYVRCSIVYANSNYLIQAAIIATRYSAVRRQSPINPNEPEPQIMDHITQRLKLFPEIVSGIAYSLAGESLWDLYYQTIEEIKEGVYKSLPDIHVLSCSLKALATIDSCAGIERLRLACGGHGYLASANFNSIYGNAVAAFTYEGENTVLLLQVGRSLIKSWSRFIQQKKISQSFSYFHESHSAPQWSDSWDGIVRTFHYIAAQRTRVAFESYAECLAKGQTKEEALNNCGILLTQAAQLHGRQFVATSFIKQVTGEKARDRSAALNKVLENCLELYLVNLTLNNMGEILRFVPLLESNLKGLEQRLLKALEAIRPDAIGICDGFDFCEGVLNSTLGAYDGNVYQRLMVSAKKSPLNQKPVSDVFEKYLKPFLKSNL